MDHSLPSKIQELFHLSDLKSTGVGEYVGWVDGWVNVHGWVVHPCTYACTHMLNIPTHPYTNP